MMIRSKASLLEVTQKSHEAVPLKKPYRRKDDGVSRELHAVEHGRGRREGQ
jgi:hypothetical protein